MVIKRDGHKTPKGRNYTWRLLLRNSKGCEIMSALVAHPIRRGTEIIVRFLGCKEDRKILLSS